MGGAQSLAHTNFAGPLAYGDKHDVHHADRAQSQRYNPHSAQKHVHRIEDRVDAVEIFNGVPPGEHKAAIAQYHTLLARRYGLCSPAVRGCTIRLLTAPGLVS